MLFTEQDAPHLKKWIVKRLENTSDADADVLADYVLALLRHDGDTETVRRLCEEEIPDFLKEDSSVFVNDVFEAIKYKSYLPGAAPPPRSSKPTIPNPTMPITLPAPTWGGDALMSGVSRGPMNGSRKRSYNDRGEGDAQDGGDYQLGGDMNGRTFKQPRRGGSMGRGGRFDSFGNGRGTRHIQPSPLHHPPMPPPGFHNLPQMPSPPPGMPPIDPMAALLAMQAYGFPQQQPPSKGHSNSLVGGYQKRSQRCRDYDTKGFCARGNTCMYEHGTDSIYVPPAALDEYDPTNSSLMPGLESTSTPYRAAPSPTTSENLRGNDRGRGRGRGSIRGDRGGSNGLQQSRRGGRAEFSSDRPNFDKSKTTIVVENIPEEKFSEETVREFFSEFGTITEVTMKPYKRLALVKYEDWAAAKAAYTSPKVIFDNRFVKVYWYSNEESLPRPPAVAGTAANGNAAQGNGTPAPTAANATPSEPPIDLEKFSRKQQEVQKAHEEKMKKKAEMETAQKELERRHEELVKKQAEEKRKLMEKLAAKTNKSGTPPVADQNGTPGASSDKPSSQTEALKAQLAALEAEAKSLGLDTSLTDDTSWRGRGRGRGVYRGRGAFVPRGSRGFDRGGYRGRGGAPFGGGAPVYKLDNRTKKVALTGVDFTNPEKDESLRQYLLGIGEFTDLETTPEKTVITFKERFTAEKFMYGTTNGEIPSAGKAELSWVQTPLPPISLASKPATVAKTENGDSMQIDEGDATAQNPSPMHGNAQGQEQQDLDYDYADDNDWVQ